VIDDVRVQIERAVPRMRIEFVQILSGRHQRSRRQCEPGRDPLFGQDLAQLEAYGEHLGEKLEPVEGLEDLYNGVSEPSAEMAMAVAGAEANRVGLTADDVSATVSAALLGVSAGEVRLDDRSVGVRVRAPDSVRFNPRPSWVPPDLLGSDAGNGSAGIAGHVHAGRDAGRATAREPAAAHCDDGGSERPVVRRGDG
jgi:hypothetical protein